MVTRRLFMLALAAAGIAPLQSPAQQRTKLARIGVLGLADPVGYGKQIESFRDGLRELGYVEGKNIFIEYRWADGHYDRLRDLVVQLVALNVDVIVTHGTGPIVAKSVTTSVPIVTYAGDMVANGLAVSLARPGGNITGTSFLGPELGAKRLELMKDAMPRLTHAAIIRNPTLMTSRLLEAMQTTAKQLKITLHSYQVKDPGELAAAFAAVAKSNAEAVLIQDDPMLIANFQKIADLALKHRLPSIGFTGYAEAGGLITSGVSLIELWRRHAYFVDKILKGASPATLPIEQPTKFELVVNLRTAKALGLNVPQTLVQRADKVIE